MLDGDKADAFLKEIDRNAQNYLAQIQPQLNAGVTSLHNLARVTRHPQISDQADQLEREIASIPMNASLASATVAYGMGDASMVQARTRKAIKNALDTATHYEKWGMGHNEVSAAARIATLHLQEVAGLLSDDAMNANVLDPAAERVRP